MTRKIITSTIAALAVAAVAPAVAAASSPVTLTAFSPTHVAACHFPLQTPLEMAIAHADGSVSLDASAQVAQ